MKYNFDKEINRRGSHCYKWDEPREEGVIPMWVADMDFEAAPAIRQALQHRVEHGIFGYEKVPESYYTAIQNWFSRRHQWSIERSWIRYTTGVVPAVTCVLKALTLPGEQVLMLTPVYNCFYSCIKNCGCGVEESRLIRQDDTYVIDFEDFERHCSDEKVTVFLLCNPHNPGGRVWTRDELLHLHSICHRHGVIVISDEIHCELVMPGYTYTPFATLSDESQDNSITLVSPSKSFNIAGLQTANIICKNPTWRRRINRVINIHEVCDLNPFGPVALEAAYNESEDWLDELNQYLWGNYQALKTFFADQLPHIKVFRLEGTYLVWVDISATGMSADEAAHRLLTKAKVMVSSGTLYGRPSGEGFLRLNIACPRQRMMEALQRMMDVLVESPHSTLHEKRAVAK